MPKRVIFLHTVLSVAAQFSELATELLPPGTEAWHIVDEILAKVVLAQGGLSPSIYRRVADHARAAQEAGAGVLQLTCSSISPCADVVRALVGIPVLKVDEPMVEAAVDMAPAGGCIAVVATAATAMGPTAGLVRACAAAAGKAVAVEAALCEGAYAGLLSGDLESHDRIVQATLAGLAGRADVILLAQASMARVAAHMPALPRSVPILTSPRPAVERLAALLAA